MGEGWGRVEIFKFCVLGGGQNIFDFRGWFSYEGEVTLLRGGGGVCGQFILSPFFHFEMQDLKNSKFFACDALIFNIHIFRFKMNAGLQVDTDF